MVSVEQVDIPASSDQPVEDIKILEEIDEAIPQHQRLPREIPRDTHQDQESLFPRVYVSVTQENSQHPGLPNSRMQYSYRHQSSQYGQHSFVQRHHYPQHTGVYYAQPHLHVNRMHADYRVVMFYSRPINITIVIAFDFSLESSSQRAGYGSAIVADRAHEAPTAGSCVVLHLGGSCKQTQQTPRTSVEQ